MPTRRAKHQQFLVKSSLHNPENQNRIVFVSCESRRIFCSLILPDTSLSCSSKFHRLSDISIESLEAHHHRSESSFSIQMIKFLMHLYLILTLDLVQTFTYQTCTSVPLGSQQTHWHLKLLRSLMLKISARTHYGLRLNAKIIDLLRSYFISSMAGGTLQTLDRAWGQGHTGCRCRDGGHVTRHAELTVTRSGLLCQDDEFFTP